MKCAYYDAEQCRSCSELPLPYADQLARKQARAQDALAEFAPIEWLPPLASAEQGFRNKAKMAIGGSTDAPTLGLLAVDGSGVDLMQCALYPDSMRNAFEPIRQALVAARVPPYDLNTRRGEAKYVLLTEAPGSGELLLRFVLRSREAIERIGKQIPALQSALPMLRVVGQIAASYIVAEAPAGMYLVDQHAAHERILYEQFMAEYTRQKTVAQLALTPESVQVAPAEARLIEEKLPLLSELGFQLEPFGPNIFIVRAVPAILSDVEPNELIRGIIDDLEQGNKPGMESIEDKIVMRVCKQAAVKAGQVLSYEQMQGLIRQLERCQSPLTCPHGRPTMIHMSNDRLAREFGRLGA